MKELLVKSGNHDTHFSLAALKEMAKALTTPLRQGIQSGPIFEGIFEMVKLDSGATSEFPLDLLAPGTEKDRVAYTIPKHGALPYNNVEGDYVIVPTFEIGNTIDWNKKYARDARWDIVNRCFKVLEAGFYKKINDDAWHVLISAAVDRNIVVFDSDANQGQFTKRLISLMKTVMRRNGGGNSTSMNRGKLTDLYVSPEAVEDVRNWNIDQVDEVTRREIFNMSDETVLRIFGVLVHDLDELGVGQEYTNFYTSTLSANLAQSGGGHGHNDTELVIGLDLAHNDSFMMPVREWIQVFEDELLARQRRAGLWGTCELGFAALDNRRCIAGSL
jgi:hypothetical protein